MADSQANCVVITSFLMSSLKGDVISAGEAILRPQAEL